MRDESDALKALRAFLQQVTATRRNSRCVADSGPEKHVAKTAQEVLVHHLQSARHERLAATWFFQEGGSAAGGAGYVRAEIIIVSRDARMHCSGLGALGRSSCPWSAGRRTPAPRRKGVCEAREASLGDEEGRNPAVGRTISTAWGGQRGAIGWEWRRYCWMGSCA